MVLVMNTNRSRVQVGRRLLVVAMTVKELPVEQGILTAMSARQNVIDFKQILRREEQATARTTPLLTFEEQSRSFRQLGMTP